MKAQDLADMMGARRVSTARWQAKCPAHPDRHPSLTIVQGRTAVLLRCWSQGCKVEAICAALGVRVSDLFNVSSRAPSECAEATRDRVERHALERGGHHAAVLRNRLLFRLEYLRDSLGGLLGQRPEDGELLRLFNGILSRLQDLEATSIATTDGPLICEQLPQSPGWIAEALHQVGADFDRKEKPHLLKVAA